MAFCYTYFIFLWLCLVHSFLLGNSIHVDETPLASIHKYLAVNSVLSYDTYRPSLLETSAQIRYTCRPPLSVLS